MNKYGVIGILFIQPVIMMGAEVQLARMPKEPKREVLRKFVELKRTSSKPIPIVRPGDYIEERPLESHGELFKASFSEQSYSPTAREVFELQY